jgi:hypothetical protein
MTRVVLVDPLILHDQLDDAPDKGGTDPFVVGQLAGFIPDTFVEGHAYGRVAQSPTDDDTPASPNVNANETFVIDIYWNLRGPLISAFDGNWAITVYFESMGPDEWDFQLETKDPIPYGCPVPPYNRDRNTRLYHVSMTVPKDTVLVDKQRGTPYELNASIVLLAKCDSLPAAVVGSIKLEDIFFFSA